jgi:hypothetical protein
LPAHRFGVARVHAIQIGSKQRGFRSAGAGANFHDGIAGIGWLRRNDAELQLPPEFAFECFEPGDFLLGHLRQFRFGGFAGEQGAILREVGLGFQESIAGGDEVLEPGVFLGKLLGALGVVKNLGIAERGFHLGIAASEFFNVRSKVHRETDLRMTIGE